MNPASIRERKLREQYREMTQDPLMMPEIGVVDLTTYHLHHLSRYISRLEGFSCNLHKPLRDFIDTDLGGCLLGCLPIIEEDILAKRDSDLDALWLDFISASNRFRVGDPQLLIDDLKTLLGKICHHLKFDPWMKEKSEQGTAPNPCPSGRFDEG